ncbi:MAG: hypothetical protein Kow0026_08440 [Oricola sp.]
MAKITGLTPEQEAMITVLREKWRAIGLSTERIDEAEAKQAIRDLYEAAGMKAPSLILAAQSPMQALLMRGVMMDTKSWGELGGQLWDQLRGELRGQLWDQLWDQLRDQLWDQLRGQLWDQLGGQLWDQLWDQLRGQLWDQLWGQLWDQLWDQLGGQLYQTAWMASGWDGYWLAFYDGGRSVGATYPDALDKHLNAYAQYAKTCGVAFCYRDIAFVSDRPTVARFDNERQLHREDGPALAWSDGYAIYAWHGTRIPAEWIDKPETLTPQLALTWENVDQRAAACEILGWHHIINALNARVLDEDEDPQIGRLVEVDLPDHGPQKFIHARCGTGREIAIMADANAKTVLEAQAASYGLKASDFQIPEIRT